MRCIMTVLALTLATAPAVAGDEIPQSIDVAILDHDTGARVYVRGDRDGSVHHKFYTPGTGYTGWQQVPSSGEDECEGFLNSVEAFAFADGSLLYVRAFRQGCIEQNIYTATDGWTGWVELPHDVGDMRRGDGNSIGPDAGDLQSVDVEIMGDRLTSPRVFVRGFDDGLLEQCVYSPTEGFTGWSEVPGVPRLMDVMEGANDDIMSVQVTPLGGIDAPRVFVVGLHTSRRVFQNYYAPGFGFTGWMPVPEKASDAFGNTLLQSVDVQHLGGGALLYLRGRFNGFVDQNLFTPTDGFSGWRRVPPTDDQKDFGLVSCAVEPFEPGVNGARIYVRCFVDDQSLQTEHCFYTPAAGLTDWQIIP